MESTPKYLSENTLPLIKEKVDAKQDKLTSGVNIKTVNNQDVLGAGNIDIPAAKLYNQYGTNEDGALNQKFASEKMQATESNVTALQGYAAKTVQTDTSVAAANASTVTIVATKGTLNSDTTTNKELPLPVASNTQAGVINAATYKSIQDSADKIESLLNATVAISDLPADATNEQLTAAWKEATSKTELVNGASIRDTTNSKQWTYYTNTGSWLSSDIAQPTIELKSFTNEAAGLIKGDTADGKISAETDGTGSVNGWDTVKTGVTNNATAIGTLQTDVSTLQTGKQDKLVSSGEGQNIKTINGESLTGTGDIEIPVMQEITTAEFEAAWDAA